VSAEDPWTGVTALVDPSRRALYDHVRRAGHPVSREAAADAVGISRGLAAFHLDKLVDVGLLRATYAASAGQPRGRPPKVYEATEEGVTLTLPERRYQLIAEILADAVADDPADASRGAVREARRRGRAVGAAQQGTDLLTALARLGFEPASERGRVLLHNCPFHALAARHTELVCGLNHAFLGGLLHGMQATGARARLAPHPGRCCVELSVPEDE
jgi:predicted ArsR family transcriptional regulator